MAWNDPRGDLRSFLNDDPNGNLVKDKTVFQARGGAADGTNSIFYTFEDRIVASGNQSVCGQPLRLFTQDESGSQAVTEFPASGILVTDPIRGEFQLMGPAPSGVLVKASYFYHEHLDADLDIALRHGVQQVSATDATQVDEGLQLAVLHFAGSFAHRKAATRWLHRKSEQFLLEDSPSLEQLSDKVAFHQSQAKELMQMGLEIRKSFYETRLDKERQPAYGLLKRTPNPYTPRR